jgi:hypothetical protein
MITNARQAVRVNLVEIREWFFDVLFPLFPSARTNSVKMVKIPA